MKATSTRLSFLSSLKKRKGLLIIITAALLLEFLSGTQYYFTHRLLEKEQELRAESELTMKAILIKSNLNDAEEVLNPKYVEDTGTAQRARFDLYHDAQIGVVQSAHSRSRHCSLPSRSLFL